MLTIIPHKGIVFINNSFTTRRCDESVLSLISTEEKRQTPMPPVEFKPTILVLVISVLYSSREFTPLF